MNHHVYTTPKEDAALNEAGTAIFAIRTCWSSHNDDWLGWKH
jgi:hypothetical protein